MTMTPLPKTQVAVQLTGPDELRLNPNKPVPQAGPYQILAKVEAVGLCFSDLKLLKQFAAHGRKGPIVSGMDAATLGQISSYVPNDAPTVPGHEAVVRIVAVGERVKQARVGKRYLVQTDYRWLPTAASNAAFGYNFEGALQQYVLMDERVITAPDGRSMLIDADDTLSASAVALVEPWACVEDAYAVKERTTLKAGGRLLIVADEPFSEKIIHDLFKTCGTPGSITLVAARNPLTMPIKKADAVAALSDAAFDDVLYFGANPQTLAALFAKIAPSGLLVLMQCGKTFGGPVDTAIGRFHYGNIRMIGTPGDNPADAIRRIPASGEIRPNDAVNVIGAGGPMGVMHVVRNLCQGVAGVSVYAGDLDDGRLAALSAIAEPLAQKNNVGYVPYNPTRNAPTRPFDYFAVMAPVPKLVAQCVADAADGAIINIFAGIPATVGGPVDVDAYVKKGCYFVGTSGSTLDDMITVLRKVQNGSLDTNISVAAVAGLNGAIDGIRAVEHHAIPGKILVYPDCDLPLTRLEELAGKAPAAAAGLKNGLWTKAAEAALIKK
jgi:threonine dehydrogenase-like Zn-dependent dehydrogenase